MGTRTVLDRWPLATGIPSRRSAAQGQGEARIEWTLTHQMPDGYMGPIPFETKPQDEPGLQKSPRRDWWPKMVMLKILQNHYSTTGDPRVIDVLDRYFRYQLRELPSKPLGHWTFWGNRRGGDNLAVVLWLYNLTGQEYLLELAKLLTSKRTIIRENGRKQIARSHAAAACTVSTSLRA